MTRAAGRTPASPKKAASKKPGKPNKPAEAGVEDFFASLAHPLKDEIAEVRAIIRGADKNIVEGVKWNSVSFRTVDYFATVNLRSTNAVQLIFHRGAKSKDGERDMPVRDPNGLIKWLSSDRCIVTVGDAAGISKNKKALIAIVCDWIAGL